MCCCSLGTPCSLPSRGSGPTLPRQQRPCTGVLGRWGAGFRPGLSAPQLRGPPTSLAHPMSGALYRTRPSPAQPEPTPSPSASRLSHLGAAAVGQSLLSARCMRQGRWGQCWVPRGSLSSYPLLRHHWGGCCGSCLGAWEREGRGLELPRSRAPWPMESFGKCAPAASGPLPAAGRWCCAPAQRCPWGRNPDLVVQPHPVISAHSRSRGRGRGLLEKSRISSADFTFSILLYPHRRWGLGPGFTERSSRACGASTCEACPGRIPTGPPPPVPSGWSLARDPLALPAPAQGSCWLVLCRHRVGLCGPAGTWTPVSGSGGVSSRRSGLGISQFVSGRLDAQFRGWRLLAE